MSKRASRYLGLFALVAMLAVLAAPIGSGTVLGQENDVAVDETIVAEVAPTATSPGERPTSDESSDAQTDPPIDQTVTPPLPAATDVLVLTETVPVGETAIPAETAPHPSETSAAIQAAEETPNPAALVEIQASFSTSHCDHSDDTWTFIVSNQVAANWNPDSIVVQFDGEADLVVSQQATSESNGVFSSYYYTSEFLNGDLVGATATVDASVVFEFIFAGGPACPPGPLATDTATVAGPTQTSTPSATATATVTQTATSTSTASATLTPTTRIDPPTLTPTRTMTIWPTHTPKPGPSATPPPGKLPGTGAGSAGSSGGVLAMMAIALLGLLGCVVRRRNRIGA